MIDKNKVHDDLTELMIDVLFGFSIRNLPYGIIKDPRKEAKRAYLEDPAFNNLVKSSVARIMTIID